METNNPTTHEPGTVGAIVDATKPLVPDTQVVNDGTEDLGRIPGTNTFAVEKLLPGAIDAGPQIHETKAWIGETEDKVPELDRLAKEFYDFMEAAYNDAMSVDENGTPKYPANEAQRRGACIGRAKLAFRTVVIETRNSLV